MKKILTNLIRLIIPRSWRNTLRRPSVTAARLRAKIEFGLGRSSIVSIRPECSVRCHPICVTEFSVFQNDPAQNAEMEDFIAHCRPGMRLLDVGAHWGVFTLAALHYGGPDVRALCVEPSPNAARVLRRNLSLNGVEDQVRVAEVAAGCTAGELQMLTTGAGGADYLVVPAESRPDSIAVAQYDLAGLCRSLGFIPTHVKMDIEGFEEEGLMGAREMLRTFRPILFLELHGELIRRRKRDPRTVLRILCETGYVTWKRAGTLMGERELENEHFNARFICVPNTKAVA